MSETVLEQILVDLRNQAVTHYPQRGEFRNLRVVGHTPKNDHFIYDACMDFAEGSERVAIKVYRSGKCGGNAKAVARQENANLQYVNQTLAATQEAGRRCPACWEITANSAPWSRTRWPVCRCSPSS